VYEDMAELASSWPAHTDAVAPIRHAVIAYARAAGATQRDIDDIALAVTEAVTNAVLHAYAHRDVAGMVTVRGSLQDHSVVFDIADDGDGLRPHAGSNGLGLGLSIIRQLADEVQIGDAPAGGTRVLMRFRLRQARATLP
jgi:serine/threonine-protein kinase RsbW